MFGWIGGVKADPDDEISQFIWDRSKTPILRSLWRPNEPNNAKGNEDHVLISLPNKFTPVQVLIDDPGSRHFFYLCETEKSVFVLRNQMN